MVGFHIKGKKYKVTNFKKHKHQACEKAHEDVAAAAAAATSLA